MPQVVRKQYYSKGGVWVEAFGGANQSATDALYVNVDGDTMTGPLTVAGDAVAPLEAVAYRQLDGLIVKPAAASLAGPTTPIPLPNMETTSAMLVKSVGDGLDITGGNSIVLTLTGWYMASWICDIGLTIVTGTRAFASINVNGTDAARASYGPDESYQSCSAVFYGQPGHVVTFDGWQSSGVAGTLGGDSRYAIHYLGENF
jgi:hypothetical protein